MAIKKIKHSRGISYELTAKINGRVVRKRRPTHKAALDEYARLRQSSNDGTYVAPADARMTVDTFAQLWLDALDAKDSTDDVYRGHYIRHIGPVIGHMAVSRVSRMNITGMVSECEAKGLAPRTIEVIYNVTAMLFRAAIDDRKRLHTPCVKIRLPEIEDRPLEFFIPDQVNQLLTAVRPEYYALLVTCVGTGLRQGELLGLTVDNVDFLKRVLYVEQQLKTPRKGRPFLTRHLKTKTSRRPVPLPQMVIDALAAHISTHGIGPDGLIFTNPHGTGWRRNSFNLSVWKPTLRRAGLPLEYGLHALRHTYASALIAKGLHALVIMKRLGHASITETMNTYGHLFPDADQETAQAIDSSFVTPAAPVTLEAVAGTVVPIASG